MTTGGAGDDDNEARTAPVRQDPWPSRLRFVGVGLLAAAIVIPISGVLYALSFGDIRGDGRGDGGLLAGEFLDLSGPPLRERLYMAARSAGFGTGLVLLVSVIVLVLDDITAGEPSRSQTPLTRVALRVALSLGVVVVAANLYVAVESVIGQGSFGSGPISMRASEVVAALSGAVLGAAGALLSFSALRDDVTTEELKNAEGLAD